MLKKLKTVVALVALAGLMSSCAVTLPVNATSNPLGSKVGKSKAVGFLGVIYLNQDASIRAAAMNGGITKISTVDVKKESILGLVVSMETIVTGE